MDKPEESKEEDVPEVPSPKVKEDDDMKPSKEDRFTPSKVPEEPSSNG